MSWKLSFQNSKTHHTHYNTQSMKKFVTLGLVLIAGMAIATAADGDKGKKGEGKGGDPAKRAEMLISKFDKDDSKTLSAEEFAATPMAEKMKTDKGEDAVTTAFGRLDKDSDGQLSQEELQKMGGGKGKGDGGGKKKKGEGDAQ